MQYFFVLSVTLFASCVLCAESDEDIVASVHALLKRRVPAIHNSVTLTLLPAKPLDAFMYYVDSGILHVTAPSGVALASGVYQYLKKHHNFVFTWGEDDSGVTSNLTVPLPDVPITTAATPYKWRYAWNVCTFGYTATWWSPKRWEWEIDWMAFHGINLPLAFVGQEHVWAKVWKNLGASEEEMQAWFTGPAFLPWQRMGNMAQWLGPLSDSYRRSQASMQQGILRQMRGFGMTPVLPCFGGHVPGVIQRIFPNVSVTKSTEWNGFPQTYLVEPTDPLFLYIGKLFLAAQQEEYGNFGYYNCDTFNEQDPASIDHKYLADAGSAVVSAIKAQDPQGVWVMQGWLFHSPSGYWRNPILVEAYLSGVNHTDMLILDLNSEMGALADKYNQYFGKPWVWNLLHNYGGQRGVYGDMNRVAQGPLEDLRVPHSSMVGIGITPEAIEQNPALYELMLDGVWVTDPINVTAWVENYARDRYGRDEPLSQEAWRTLYTAVYSDWQFPYTDMHQLPEACNLGTEGGDGIGLVRSWELLLLAGNGTRSVTPTYLYDLADVARMALNNYFLDLQKLLCHEFNYMADAGRWKGLSDRILGLLSDLDSLMATDSNFLLGRWVAKARAAATSAAEVTQFVQNAINQVTLWGPNGEINDYAEKAWADMYGQYYLARWNLYLSTVYDNIVAKTFFDSYAFQTAALKIGQGFYQNTTGSFVINGTGDTYAVAQQLFLKYASYPRWEEHFIVYNDTDIPGHDVGLLRPLFSRKPEQLMRLCDADVLCVCVNSNGYVKNADGPRVTYPGNTVYCLKKKGSF